MNMRQNPNKKTLIRHPVWTKVMVAFLLPFFLLTSIHPTFATPSFSNAHLRTLPLRSSDGGTKNILDEFRLEGDAAREAELLTEEVELLLGEAGQGNGLEDRIVVLKEVLNRRADEGRILRSPVSSWIPILTYALAPRGKKVSLYTEVEKNREAVLAQCKSCGTRLVYNASPHSPNIRNSRIPKVDTTLDLIGALATAIDAVSQGGLIKTHPTTEEVMHSAYALKHLLGGYVRRGEVNAEELTMLGSLLVSEEFYMAHVKEANTSEGDHFVQLKSVRGEEGSRTVTFLDRGQEKTVSEAKFLEMWTGIVISPSPSFARSTVPDREAQNIYGCCGISAASGTGLYIATDASERPVAKSFYSKLASIAKRVINILQSRGFDNYADARKYWFWVSEEYPRLPDTTRQAIENDPTMSVLDVQGERRLQHKVLKFMVTSRGVGSSIANSDIITRDLENKILEIASKVFPDKQLFVANDIRTSDYYLFDQAVMRPRDGDQVYSLAETVEVAKEGIAHAIRFRAESREEIERAFAKEERGFQNYSVVKTDETDIWEIYSNDLALRRVYLEGVNKHTRYKTKGTDRKVNAHHWVYKGYTLGHNGDFESFHVFRTILEEVFGEKFEGQTDSEVLLHLIGDLGEQRAEEGVTYLPTEAAIRRAFRLVEHVETLLSLRKILSDRQFEGYIQENVIDELKRLGQTADDIAKITQDAQYGRKGEISEAVAERIVASIKSPENLDEGVINFYAHFLEFFGRLSEGKFVKAAEQARKVLERGVSNIAINAMSLHDTHQIVVARMYEDNNKFFLVLSRDGDTVVMGSEARGAAPEVGIMTEQPRDAIPNVLAIARGRIKQIESPPWSVLTVDGVHIQHHEIWGSEPLDGRDLVQETEIKWNVIKDERAYHSETDFERETKLQPTTVRWTVDSFTQRERNAYYLKTDELNLQEDDFRRAPVIVGIGSGSSFNALRQVQEEMGYFDIVETSNDIQFEFPKSIQPGSIMVIVSQSGETGAALTAAKLAIDKGAKVVAVTNRRGSSLYNIGKASGGVMVTESVDEQAVAATGSNSGQVQALRIFGLRRGELLGEISATEVSKTLSQLDQLSSEGIPRALTSFDGGQKVRTNDRVVSERLFPYMDAHGVEGSFVGNQFILTGIGSIRRAAADEIGLKITEVSRHPIISVDMDTLLGYDIGDAPKEPLAWTGEGGIDSLILHNLRAYTTRGTNQIGEKTEFGVRQHFRVLTTDIKQASQIVLLSNGEFDAATMYLYSKYRGSASIPIVLKKYSDKMRDIKKGAIVIAFDPEDSEARQALHELEAKGIKPVAITTPTKAAKVPIPAGGVLVARGTEGNKEYAFTLVSELLLAHLLEMRGDVDDILVSRVIQGYEAIDIAKTIESFSEQDHDLHNAENLARLIQVAKNRKWQFNIWSTGKTSLLGAAVDLSLRVFSATGRLAGWGETSEFKHGPYSATNYGDIFITQYPGAHAVERPDVIKTAIDEVIPRINYPYTLLSRELEPGTVVFIGTADEQDGYMRFLDDGEFENLRDLRRSGKHDEGLRPDIVFLTPTGHFLERLVVNRLISQSLAQAQQEDIAEDRPGNIIFVVEGDPSQPGYAAIAQNFMEKKRRLRAQFPNALVISIAPHSNNFAKETSDAVLETVTGDFTEALVVGHLLASRLVRHRFGDTVARLISLYQDIEGHAAHTNSNYSTPGELLMGFALEEEEARLVVTEIIGTSNLEAFKEEITKTFELVNLDFFKAFNSARLENELWHSLIDLIEKLAKVVTNRGYNRQEIRKFLDVLVEHHGLTSQTRNFIIAKGALWVEERYGGKESIIRGDRSVIALLAAVESQVQGYDIRPDQVLGWTLYEEKIHDALTIAREIRQDPEALQLNRSVEDIVGNEAQNAFRSDFGLYTAEELFVKFLVHERMGTPLPYLEPYRQSLLALAERLTLHPGNIEIGPEDVVWEEGPASEKRRAEIGTVLASLQSSVPVRPNAPSAERFAKTTTTSASDGGTKTLSTLKGEMNAAVPELEEKLHLLDPVAFGQKLIQATEPKTKITGVSRILGREFVVHQDQAIEAMPFAKDFYRSDIVIGLIPQSIEGAKIVGSVSRLIDPRLTDQDVLELLDHIPNLYFMEPRSAMVGELMRTRPRTMERLRRENRMVLFDLASLKGTGHVIFLLDGVDRDKLGVRQDMFLTPVPVQNIDRAFVVPLTASLDITRELYLGLYLASQVAQLDQLESLDAATKLLLSEVAKGFVVAEKTLVSIQDDLTEAQSIVTTVLKGL